MKRIRLLILLSVLAVALPVGVLSGVAKATSSTGATSQLSIDQNSQYDVDGFIIHVGLRARCPASLLFGTIEVTVTQSPPESPTPAVGTSLVKDVVCDGQTHTVGASIHGEGFDEGRAWAKAEFLSGGSAKAERWINIIVMPG